MQLLIILDTEDPSHWNVNWEVAWQCLKPVENQVLVDERCVQYPVKKSDLPLLLAVPSMDIPIKQGAKFAGWRRWERPEVVGGGFIGLGVCWWGCEVDKQQVNKLPGAMASCSMHPNVLFFPQIEACERMSWMRTSIIRTSVILTSVIKMRFAILTRQI